MTATQVEDNFDVLSAMAACLMPAGPVECFWTLYSLRLSLIRLRTARWTCSLISQKGTIKRQEATQ